MGQQRPLSQDADGIRLSLPETCRSPEAVAGEDGKPDHKSMRNVVCGEDEFQSSAKKGKKVSS